MDEADWASRMETAERDAAIRRVVARHRVQQLRIDDEIVCRDCYDPIPQARLEAAPGAAHCVDCLELMEREERLYGD